MDVRIPVAGALAESLTLAADGLLERFGVKAGSH